MRVPLTPRSSLFDIPHLTRREDFMRQVPLLPCRLCRDPATVTFADLTHNFHSKYFFNKKYFALQQTLNSIYLTNKIGSGYYFSFVEEKVKGTLIEGSIIGGLPPVDCSSEHKGLHTQRANLGLLSVLKSIFYTIKWRRERQ